MKLILLSIFVAGLCLKAQCADDKKHVYCCAVDDKEETVETRSRAVSVMKPHITKHIIGYKPCDPSESNNGNKIKVPSLQELLKGFYEHSTKTPLYPTDLPCQPEPIYKEVTYMKTSYEVGYYKVKVIKSHCPPEHVICCKGHTMLNGECIEDSLASSFKELFDLGLIG